MTLTLQILLVCLPLAIIAVVYLFNARRDLRARTDDKGRIGMSPLDRERIQRRFDGIVKRATKTEGVRNEAIARVEAIEAIASKITPQL